MDISSGHIDNMAANKGLGLPEYHGIAERIATFIDTNFPNEGKYVEFYMLYEIQAHLDHCVSLSEELAQACKSMEQEVAKGYASKNELLYFEDLKKQLDNIEGILLNEKMKKEGGNVAARLVGSYIRVLIRLIIDQNQENSETDLLRLESWIMGILPDWVASFSGTFTKDNDFEDRFNAFVEENIVRILELERAHQGSATVLHERFGITCFGRYPLHILLNQYENMNENLPFVAMLRPIPDQNGFTYRWSFPDSDIEGYPFNTQLGIELEKHGSLLRVFEFNGSAQALVKIFKDIKTRYGSDKMLLFHLDGHGNSGDDFIDFGIDRLVIEDNYEGSVDIRIITYPENDKHRAPQIMMVDESLYVSIMEFLKDITRTDTLFFVLGHCYAGLKGGVADALSRHGFMIAASSGVTHATYVSVAANSIEGAPTFDVHYMNEGKSGDLIYEESKLYFSTPGRNVWDDLVAALETSEYFAEVVW